MLFNTADFRITSGTSFRLKDHPTELKNGPDKDDLKASVATDRARISELQELRASVRCYSFSKRWMRRVRTVAWHTCSRA
jgi:hypothetical protein